MWRVSLFLLFLAGCAPSDPTLLIDGGNQTSLVGRQAPLSPEAVRAAVRIEAARLHSRECGAVTIPDDAFVPVEVTGGGDPEYAVFFGRARCDLQGGLSFFSGTGGAQIEIWSSSGDAPQLLLRRSMHGFSPTPTGLVSLQHGSFCPGGAGPGMCLVTYEWKGPEDGFEVRSRRLYDYQHPGEPPAMRYEWSYPSSR